MIEMEPISVGDSKGPIQPSLTIHACKLPSALHILPNLLNIHKRHKNPQYPSTVQDIPQDAQVSWKTMVYDGTSQWVVPWDH